MIGLVNAQDGFWWPLKVGMKGVELALKAVLSKWGVGHVAENLSNYSHCSNQKGRTMKTFHFWVHFVKSHIAHSFMCDQVKISGLESPFEFLR